jgi:hypothetical protein
VRLLSQQNTQLTLCKDMLYNGGVGINPT